MDHEQLHHHQLSYQDLHYARVEVVAMQIHHSFQLHFPQCFIVHAAAYLVQTRILDVKSKYLTSLGHVGLLVSQIEVSSLQTDFSYSDHVLDCDYLSK